MVKLTFTLGGSKFWFLNGEFHRSNGPAVVWHRNGTIRWCWHGQVVTEYEHMMLVVQEQTNG